MAFVAASSVPLAGATAAAAPGSDPSFVAATAQPWILSGIWVKKGQPVTVTATGVAITWVGRAVPGSLSGPEGQSTLCLAAPAGGSPCTWDDPDDPKPYGALLLDVGGTKVDPVIGVPFSAPATGQIGLAVNDNVGHRSDNSGGYTVWIAVG